MQEAPRPPESESGQRQPPKCLFHLWQGYESEPLAGIDGPHGCEPWWKLRCTAGMLVSGKGRGGLGGSGVPQLSGTTGAAQGQCRARWSAGECRGRNVKRAWGEGG